MPEVVNRARAGVRDGAGSEAHHSRVDSAFDRLLTPRLVLRRFVRSDAAALARYRSDPDVARYQSWDAPFELAQAEALVEWLDAHHPDEPGEWFQIAIAERRAPDRLVGDCAFRPMADEPRVAAIGYSLSREVQGRGYASEAVGELMRYLFEDRGKHRLMADCDARNEPSWRLLDRLGFTREGVLRECFADGEGGWADELLYGLLEREWRARLMAR